MTEELMTMKFTQEGDSLNVSTEFARDVSKAEALKAIRSGVLGMVELAIKIGTASGLTEDEVTSMLFDAESEAPHD